MQTAIDATIQIFVISTMLVLGLQVQPQRIVRGLRNWGSTTTGSLLNLIVVPALGLLAASGLDLSGEIRAGYLLIAFSPAAPYAVKLIAIARGRDRVVGRTDNHASARRGGLGSSSSEPLSRPCDRPGVSATICGHRLTSTGPLDRRSSGAGYEWMGSPVTTRAVGAISNASFAVLVALILIHDLPRVVQILDIRVLTAVVGLIVASLTTGVFLAGREPSVRRSLGLVSAARKGGLALVIATTTFGGDADAVIVIVAYALIELVLLTTVAVWWRASGSRVTPRPRFSGG